MAHAETLSPTRETPFVGRSRELGIVARSLKYRTTEERVGTSIIHFHGEFGSGKTWLLRELQQRYKGNAEAASPTIATYTDFSQSIPTRLELIKALWKEFHEQNPDHFPPLQAGDTETDKLAAELVGQIHSTPNTMTPVLLFDGIDELFRKDPETFAWLEKNFVEPVIDNSGTKSDTVQFVFASRNPLRYAWKEFQTRRRVLVTPIELFDEQELRDQAQITDPQISRRLFETTAGNPYFAYKVVEALKTQGVVPKTATPEIFEAALARVLAGDTISELAARILGDLPDELANSALMTSALRWANNESVARLDDYLSFSPQGKKSQTHYLETIIQPLIRASVMGDYSVRHGQNAYPSGVRRILSYEFARQNRQTFLLSHFAAFTYCADHLMNHPQFLRRYLPELVYHYRTLQEHGFQIPREYELKPKFLEAAFNQFIDAKFRGRGKEDELKDKEIALEELIDELYIPDTNAVPPEYTTPMEQFNARELRAIAPNEYEEMLRLANERLSQVRRKIKK
jgi:hypothetical protein